MLSANSDAFLDKARSLRPIYFIVVVWADRYVDLLLNFCLPSLLSPGNIPTLLNTGKNKLLIVTTADDWQQIKCSPILKRLSDYVEPLHIEITRPPPDASVYDHMSVGHKLATQRAFQDKAYGVLLTPDMLISDGSIAAIQKHAVSGMQVVLTAALRYGEEPLFQHLESMGLVSANSRLGDAGQALTVTGRQLAFAGVNSFHNETLRFEWDAPYFEPYFTGLPGTCWWRIPREDGVLLHTASWAAVLVDYGSLVKHDTSTMDHWAIDGDYVYRNFGDGRHVYVVQDSDEVMLVSWTSMRVLDLNRRSKRLLTLPRVGEFINGCLLRDAFLGPTSDPLKRRIIFLPVYFHGHDLNKLWHAVELCARKTIQNYLGHEQGLIKLWAMRIVGTVHRISVLVLCRWRNRRHIIEMTRRTVNGDSEARKYLQRRVRLYLRQLIGKSINGK